MAEKADLQKKAAELGLDTDGTTKELKARIAEHEAAQAAEPEPTPEEIRAKFEADREAERNTENQAKAKAKAAEAARQSAEKVQLARENAAERNSAPEQDAKQRELDAKEGSLRADDPRGSVTDAAPGKSFDDVVERNAALARGEFTDTADADREPQFYVVQDEHDIIEVAATLGLNHLELGAFNGQANLQRGVSRGQRVALPPHYTFVDVPNVDTESELAGSEPTA
jgi:hypothetical protein